MLTGPERVLLEEDKQAKRTENPESDKGGKKEKDMTGKLSMG